MKTHAPLLIILSFFCLAACSPAVIQSREMPNTVMAKYANSYNTVKAASATDSGFIGFTADTHLTIKVVSAYAKNAGLQVGDRIVKVNSIDIHTVPEITSLVRKTPPQDMVTITVNRRGNSVDLRIPCRNSRDMMMKAADVCKAASEGNWDRCIELSYELDNQWLPISATAYTRCDCSEAKRLQSMRPPNVGDAEVAYEARRRKINEILWAGDDLSQIQADVIKTISFFQQAKQDRFANELQQVWDDATRQSKENVYVGEMPVTTSNQDVKSTVGATEIPLTREGGVYKLPVKINGVITLNFILDTGASEVSIPADVALTLLRSGTIGQGDFLPGQSYELGDGTVVNSPRFIIRELDLGGVKMTQVPASIASHRAKLLLGQSFLSRLESWSLENTRHVLIIKGIRQ